MNHLSKGIALVMLPMLIICMLNHFSKGIALVTLPVLIICVFTFEKG